MVEERLVWIALKKAIDPELGISVVDLGLIKKIEVKKDVVKILMTVTSPYCPLTEYLKEEVRNKVCSIKGVKSCSVELVLPEVKK